MVAKTSPPWEGWARTLRAVEDALVDIDEVYRGDPLLPQYVDLLHRKRWELRALIRRFVERN